VATELFRFLACVLVLTIPGVLLAARLRLGPNRLECWSHGACLGLALAVYIASVISHFNLAWFNAAWAIVGILSLVAFCRPPMPRFAEEQSRSSTTRWLPLVLLIVAVSRYAFILGHVVPNGDDPPIFLILARKIQLAQHAVYDWSPFETAPLNYPTGAHTLLAVMSSMCGLPLETVFKYLIPFMGILMTAQVFIFAKGVTADPTAALFAALAYGLWAGDGSIRFYNWGGLPNELAILLFLSTLTAWLESCRWPNRLAAMSVLYAAVILVHHHTLLASAGVIATLLAVTIFRAATRPAALLLLGSGIGALALDSFFVVSYAAKAATLSSTNVFHSEWRLNLLVSGEHIGFAYVLAAAVGLAVCLRQRRILLHPAAIGACAALAAMFIACEYILPIWLSPRGRFPTTVFAPSHFLNEIVCFLAVFVGIAIAWVQHELRLRTGAVVAAMLLVGVSQLDAWREIAEGPSITPEYVQACHWIQHNTSPTTLLLADNWGMYLSWRRGATFWLPDSESHANLHPQALRIPLIESGQIPPDSPDMKIVEIVHPPTDSSRQVLWRGSGGMEVVQDWPR
jgi:hypothetical protein